MKSGREVPYQVPVTIRAKIDPLYQEVRRKTDAATAEGLAQWIDALDGEKQGISLIALLEIKMHTDGPVESSKLLGAIMKQVGQVQSLRHVSEEQISNFFATYVRAFRDQLTAGSNEEILGKSLDYFASFWTLCTAQYSGNKADNYLSLFKAAIRKLDNIDIPLCLWTFLAGSGTSYNMGDPAVEELHRALETELHYRLPSRYPPAIPAFITLQFLLSAGNFGFFDIMHRLMETRRKKEWRAVWQACQREELYTALLQATERNTTMFEKMLPHVMQS